MACVCLRLGSPIRRLSHEKHEKGSPIEVIVKWSKKSNQKGVTIIDEGAVVVSFIILRWHGHTPSQGCPSQV